MGSHNKIHIDYVLSSPHSSPLKIILGENIDQQGLIVVDCNN